jgi:hypothetical protein
VRKLQSLHLARSASRVLFALKVGRSLSKKRFQSFGAIFRVEALFLEFFFLTKRAANFFNV